MGTKYHKYDRDYHIIIFKITGRMMNRNNIYIKMHILYPTCRKCVVACCIVHTAYRIVVVPLHQLIDGRALLYSTEALV